MSWFRVDDGFHRHRKTRRAMRRSVESIALWTLAGTYCSEYATDGRGDGEITLQEIAEEVLDCPKKKALRLSEILVEVGLWERVAGTDDVYRFHDWLDYNPPASTVKSRRDADAARKRVARENQHRSAAGKFESNGSAALGAVVRADVPQDSAKDSSRTDDGRPPLPIPIPIPIPREGERAPAIASMGVRTPLRPDEPLGDDRKAILDGLKLSSGANLDAETEWAKFKAHVADAGKTSANWDEAWRKWVIDAVKFARSDRERARGRAPTTRDDAQEAPFHRLFGEYVPGKGTTYLPRGGSR